MNKKHWRCVPVILLSLGCKVGTDSSTQTSSGYGNLNSTIGDPNFLGCEKIMGKLEPQFRVKRHSDGKVIVPTFLVDPNPDNGSLVTGIHFGLMPTSSSSPNMNSVKVSFVPNRRPTDWNFEGYQTYKDKVFNIPVYVSNESSSAGKKWIPHKGALAYLRTADGSTGKIVAEYEVNGEKKSIEVGTLVSAGLGNRVESSKPNVGSKMLWAKFGPGICPLVLDGQTGPSGTDFRFSFFVGAEVALPKPVPSVSTENCDSTKPNCVSSPEPTNNGLPSGEVPALAPEVE